jgi:biopolymer transport protein ExbD
MAIGKLPDADDDGDGDAIFAEINITPLTDVFLVLLIIFMISALAVQVEERKQKKKAVEDKQKMEQKIEIAEKSGIKISLPAGQAQEIDTSKKSLVLVVPIDGDVQVGGKAMVDKDLDNIFRAAFQQDKQTQVVIKADKGVAHGKVVNLMERAKQAGLTHLAIGTSG